MAHMIDWSSLWSTDTEQRTAALSDFVLSLETIQRPSTSSTSLDDLHPDIAYALKRLIRGLSSPRDAARVGFAVGLTELLSRLPQLPVSPVIEMLLTHTEVTGSTKGEEGRDRHFGRLVGIEALVASGLLSSPLATVEDLQAICRALLGLFDAKSYLKESAGLLTLDLIRALPRDANKRLAMRNLLLNPSRPMTAESIAWSIALGEDILSTSILDSVIKTLKSTHSIKSVDGVPHFVWKSIATTSPSSAVVERLIRPLLTREASVTQRREGILALSLLMTSSEQLSRSVFQLTVEASIKGKGAAPGMALAAKMLLRRAEELLKAAPSKILPTLVSSVGEDGSGYFPALSQSKALESMAAHLPETDKKRWLAMLRSIIVSPVSAEDDIETEDRATTQLRRWAIEQTASLENAEATDVLCVHGFFNVLKPSHKTKIEAARKVAEPPLPEVLRELCRSRLYSILAKDLQLLDHAAATLLALSQDRKHLSPVLRIDAEASATVRKAAQEFLLHASDDRPEQAALVRLLQCITIVSYEDPLICPMLESLASLGTNLISSDGMDTASIDEMVAHMMALLRQPQSLVRPVVENTFRAFADRITEPSVDILIEMIAPEVLADSLPDEDIMEGIKSTNGHVDSDSEEDSDEESVISLGSTEELMLDLGEVNVALRDKVEAALREVNMVDGDEDEDEAPLDDEAMLALDEQLAAAFRSESKAVSKKATALHDANARLKVLDLLQLYLRAKPTSHLLPKVVAALHAASADPELNAKATRVLNSVLATKVKAADVGEQLAEQAGVYLDRVLFQSNRSTQATATYLLRLIASDRAAADALTPAIEAFISRKRPLFTESTLVALAKARPAVFTESIQLFVKAGADGQYRPMRQRQFARISAALLQVVAPVSAETAWAQLGPALQALAATIDPSGPADVGREQLKSLTALLRFVRNPAKLPSKGRDVDAVCARAVLDSKAEEDGSFAGSKPCKALAKEVSRMVTASTSINGSTDGLTNGLTNGTKPPKRKAEVSGSDVATLTGQKPKRSKQTQTL